MKHKLRSSGLMLALAMLCTLLFAGPAYATGDQPAVTVDGVAATQATTEYSGQYYYWVSVTKPNGAETFQTGWNDNVNADRPEQWETEDTDLSFPVTGGEDISQDAFFVRLNENAPVQKFVFRYKLDARADDFAVTGSNITLLNENAELSWTQQSKAVWGWVTWTLPNGDGRFHPLREKAGSVSSLKLTDFWDGARPEDIIPMPGTYTAEVILLVDNKLATGTQSFEVGMPASAGQKPDLDVEDETITNGTLTVPMHKQVDYRVKLPEGVDSEKTRVQVYTGQWLEDAWWDDGDGCWRMGWRPDFDSELVKDGQATSTAFARYSTDDGNTWTYSENLTVKATVTGTIDSEITGTIAGRTIPRDGVLEVKINNVADAEQYGVFVLDSNDNWVTDSDPKDADAGATTTVNVPMARCEVGETYLIFGYATKTGAAKQSNFLGAVTVLEARNDSNGLIISDLEQEYSVGQPIDLSVYYTKGQELEDSLPEGEDLNLWMQTEISYDGETWTDDCDGWDYRNNGLRFWSEGTYGVKATVYRGDPDDRFMLAEQSASFTVTSAGDLPDDYKPFEEDYIPRQGTYTLQVAQMANVKDPEVYASVWTRCENDSDEDWMSAEENGWPSFSFDTTKATAVNLEVRVRAKDQNGVYYNERSYRMEGIPVMDASEISDEIKVEVFNANGEATAPTKINQPIKIKVTAPGASMVRLADSGNDWLCADDTNSKGIVEFEDRRTWDEPGTYRLWAVAGYGTQNDDGEYESYKTSPIQTFELSDTETVVDDFRISLLHGDTVQRGEDVTVRFENNTTPGTEYDVDIWRDDDVDYDPRWNWSEKDTAVIHTAGLPAGKYSIVGHGRAENAKTQDSEETIELTVEDRTQPGEVRIFVDNYKPNTCEDINISVYAPGANKIELYKDYKNNPRDYDTRWDEDFLVTDASYDRGGTYTIAARAYYPDHEPVETSDTVWVNAQDNLEVTAPVLPDSLTVGEGLEFTAQKPKNADGINVMVEVEPTDGDWRRCYDEESKGAQSVDVKLNAETLGVQVGDIVHVKVYAWAEGWNADEKEVRIPVKPTANATDVTMAFVDENGNELQGTTVTVQTNQPVRVKTTGTEQVRNVVIYDGRGFRDPEDLEGSSFTREDELWFDESGTYQVYATVTYQGGTQATTNSLTVNVESNGPVQKFKFVGDDPGMQTVNRGETVKYTFEKSLTSDAEYWICIDDVDGNQYRSAVTSENNNTVTVTLYTADLMPGTYCVRGVAGNVVGKENYVTSDSATLTVVQKNDQEQTVSLNLSKTANIKTGEEIIASAFAPNAKFIGISVADNRYSTGPDEEFGFFSSESWTDDQFRFEKGGIFYVKAWAQFEDGGEWKASEPVVVTVLEEQQDAVFKLYATVNGEQVMEAHEGSEVTIVATGTNLPAVKLYMDGDALSQNKLTAGEAPLTLDIHTITAKVNEGQPGEMEKTMQLKVTAHDWTYRAIWNSVMGEMTADVSKTCAVDGCNEFGTETEGVTVQSETIEEPTCTEKGKKTLTAKYDGQVLSPTKTVEIPATGHKMPDQWTAEWDVDTENHTANVTIVKTCQNDGCGYKEVAPWQNDVWVSTAYSEGICTGEGTITYTAVQKVGSADTLLDCVVNKCKEQVTAGIGHKWGNWQITKQASCTQTGTQERNCSNPGCNEKQTMTMPKLNHDWGEWSQATDATCTEDGKTESTCQNENCGEKKTIIIPATGHSWGDAAYEWSEATGTDLTCTASHTCGNKNCPLKNKPETVTVTAAKKQGANACETIYTAAFGKDGFKTQTKTITAHVLPLEHHDAVAAQIGVAGNVEYWECTRCHTFFQDAQGTIVLADVVIPALQPTPQPGGGGATPDGTTITVPVSGEDKSVNLTVKVEKDKATITSADVDEVLAAEDVGVVTVDVSGLTAEIKEVVLPAELVRKISTAVADNKNDASGLEIRLREGSVTFDKKALASIADQSKGKDLHLNLDVIAQSQLNEKQQATVAEMSDAVVVDAYITADGKRITDFNGGTATLSVGFNLKEGQKAEGVAAWYVADDGTKTEVPCTYSNNKANIGVPHFSNYVVAYDESRVKKEEPEPEPTPEPTPATPTDIGYDNLSDKEKKQADQVVKALGVDKDTAAQMVKTAASLGVSIDTVKLSEKTLSGLDVDSGDPKGSDFGKLNARTGKRTNSAVTLTWTKQKQADGYLIYGNQCGKKYKMKLLKTITKNKTVSFTQKKLKKGTYYKYMVVAYKNVNGQKMPITASVVVHTATKGGKVTDPKSVSVNKAKVSLKKGKTFTIKAKVTAQEKKNTLKKHRAVKFESSNKAVAAVSAKGKITAKKKGKATIYAYAQNGTFAKITVTVK